MIRAIHALHPQGRRCSQRRCSPSGRLWQWAERKDLPQRPLQGGLSLIELMVVLALTMLLSVIAASVYLVSARGHRATDELAQLNEQARLAFELMGRDLRQAGFTRAWLPGEMHPRAPIAHALAACDTGFSVMSSMPDQWRCAATGAHAALAIRYETDAVDTAAAQGTNCLGNTPPHYRYRNGVAVELVDPAPVMPAPGVVPLVSNFYFISRPAKRGDDKADGRVARSGQLNCAAVGEGGTLSPSQPLLSGIEDLQLQFVVAPDSADESGLPHAAMSATELNDMPGRWEDVVAVRVCLLLRTASQQVARAPQPYVNCHGRQVMPEPDDRSLWRAWTETFTLRNRAGVPE